MATALPLKEKLGLAFYFLTFSGGIWCWPATFLLGYYITNVFVRTFLLVYLFWIWLGRARDQSSNPEGAAPLRRLPIWRWCAAYFPMTLQKTADISAEGSYLFGIHPHGILSVSGFVSFATEGCGFSSIFPGLVMHLVTLVPHFYTPFLRDFLLGHGIRDCARTSLLRILARKGHCVAIIVGGARESLAARPGVYDIVLEHRKGFVRVAVQAGASLVPVICFGETSIFDVKPVSPGSRFGKFQRWLLQVWGCTMPLVQPSGGFLKQHNCPINVVVGEPLPVPKFEGDIRGAEGQAVVDKVHGEYVAALRKLWDQHKDQYALERAQTLRIID